MDLPAGFRQAYEMVQYLSCNFQLNTVSYILNKNISPGIGEFCSNGKICSNQCQANNY